MSTQTNLRKALAGLLLMAGAPLGASVSQELVLGVQSVDQNNPEAKFEEYRDVSKGPVIEEYSVVGESNGWDYHFQANNLREEDQSAALCLGAGKLSLGLAYDQSPHRWSSISQTLYREESPGVLRLPDGMQGAIQTGAGTGSAATQRTNWFNLMTSTYAGLAHTQDLETRQDKTGIRMDYALSDRLGARAQFAQQKKDGHKLQAFAFGRNHSVELAKPVDETAYESNLSLDYVGEKTNWGLGYGLSLYDNEIETLVWDNSKRTTDRFTGSGVTDGNDSAQGRAAMQPDNASHALTMNFGVALPAQSRFRADVSYTKMVQNEEMLPYTINSLINASSATVGLDAHLASSLPQSKVGAEQTLVVQNYDLTNQTFSKWNFGARVRSEQLGNSSDLIQFAGHSAVDQTWASSATSAANTVRFAYRKLTFGANADYALSSKWNLSLDAAREKAIREHREYRETLEDIVTGKVSYRPVLGFSVRARVVNADRKAEEFEIEDYLNYLGTAYAELPGMRRVDIASRHRNSGDLTVQGWRGPWSITLTGGLTHDRFRGGNGDLQGSSTVILVSTNNLPLLYGLLENRSARAGLDLTLDVSDRVGVYGFYQYEHVRGVQRSNTSSGGSATQNAAEDWTAASTDRYDTAGLGVDTDLTAKLRVSLGYDLARSRGATDFLELGTSLATKLSPPETVTTKQDYSIRGEYQAKKDLALELGYTFERYDVSDYATDDIPMLAGSAAGQTNIFLADTIMDYRAHIVSAKIKYKW